MFRYSPGMRLGGVLIGCFFGWCSLEILGRGNPDEMGLGISAAAFALIGFSTLFARYG